MYFELDTRKPIWYITNAPLRTNGDYGHEAYTLERTTVQLASARTAVRCAPGGEGSRDHRGRDEGAQHRPVRVRQTTLPMAAPGLAQARRSGHLCAHSARCAHDGTGAQGPVGPRSRPFFAWLH